nr:uncharacterized protein LOC117275117 [Nicotiana tomentosiformis]
MEVPDKRFKRKDVADNVVKQAPAAWGDSSSESGDDDDQGDNFMMAVESEVAEYDSIFALMAKSDEDKEDDDEDDDEDEVNFLDVQRNLKSYSQKKLISLANILIDAYHSLINDKNALTTKLGEIKHERDDLVVVVVDLRETVESLKREKNILTERIANIEHEKDDLLVLVVDLKETIEELRRESRPMNTQKGKEVASEAHPRLENELKSMKSSMCAELEKNRQLQEDLGIVKSDLEKSLKWTWSTDVITAMYTNSGGNRHGIGFQKEKNPKNPRSKYVTVPDNWLCTHCGNTRHVKKTCKVRFQSQQKNKVFAEKICDKGNKVKFVSKICTVTNLVTGNVILMAKRYKNIYVAYFESLHNGDLTCLSDVDDDAELWHKRLGNASFTLLNKLVRKDLVRGFLKSSFKDHKVCDACAKGKQIRSNFKPKKEVSTSRSLDLLHIDLCGPMRVPSKGGKKYILVIVDDYSRFTWTLFLRTKDETFSVFASFVKKIQVKMIHNVVSIRSDHGTKFDNAKFDEFCAKNGISHNFSAPRTPQQNGVVERKNRTLEDMARTMLIDSGIAKGFWDKEVNTACYLVNRYMIRSLLNKTPYELLNGRKPKLTHLRTFGYKCFILNNGKKALGKFDAKSDEGIFLGYSSQSKAYKADQDGELSNVPGEVIDMANGKADMSQVKESNDNGTTESPTDIEESGPSITITEAENTWNSSH